MADMQAFEFLCRVCASDTKGKSSVAECVYVLKTADLKEKMKKYLDLKVSEDDALPKVICKSCYRSVEGIVSLSKIAVHTQMVLSNFLKPRVALIEPDAEFTTIVSPVRDYERALGSTAPAAKTKSQTTPTATAQLPKDKQKRIEDVIVNVSVSDPLTRETQQKIIGASRQRQQTLIDSRFIPKSIAHRHVSFAAVGAGLVANSTSKEASPPTPPLPPSTSKSSLSSTASRPPQQETPKAAASTGAATPPSTDSSKNGSGSVSSGGISSVINFFNSQQPQQQVTVTSGGYVIGQLNTGSPSNNSSSSNSLRSAPSAAIAATPDKPHLQESSESKRKMHKLPTMKNVPRNITSAGQISLLKVSHKTSSLVVNASLSSNSLSDASLPEEPTTTQSTMAFNRARESSPPMRKARRPQRRPTIAEIPSSVEALPREIIIASVKKPKHKNLTQQQRSTTLQAGANATAATAAAAPLPVKQKTPPSPPPQILTKPKSPAVRNSPEVATPTPLQLLKQQQKQQQQQPQQQSQQQQQQQPVIPKSLFPDDIPLGRVIRDFDLLKLIMKALKWPVIKENMDAQLERLRNSKFTTIMSDPNLLQDTDLTQLLGPYLAPVMYAAQKLQQQQQQQAAMAAAMSTPPKSASAHIPKAKSPIETPTDLSSTASANLANAIPYRLPPETSVQLVPASPDEEQAANDAVTAVVITKKSQHKSRKAAVPHKRSRRTQQSPRLREVFVISDGEEDPDIERSTSNNTSQISGANSSFSGSGSSKNSSDKANQEKHKKSVTIADPPASYDALKQLAERSNAALDRIAPTAPATVAAAAQRARSGADKVSTTPSPPQLPQPMHYSSFVEKIVQMEPEQALKANKIPKPQDSLPSVISMTSPDHLFSARAVPPITRPIIKRRKTVIHSSAVNNKNDAAANKSDKLNKSDAAFDDKPKPSDTPDDQLNSKVTVATSMSFFSGVTAHITGGSSSPLTDTPSTTTIKKDDSSPTASIKEETVKDNKDAVKKPLSTKAALAEQLLEAVGLKKSNGATVEKTPSRESVQQIRSALKRSLKQAVEQNLRKHEEQPVKQVADSTTKSAIKSTEPVDIEDQIEKITLQKAPRQVSLLKTNKSQESMKSLPASSRSTSRLSRKSLGQPSVIQVAELDKKKPMSKSKSAGNLLNEADLQEKKSTFSQTSPLTSETDLSEFVISGNKVSSTSEPSLTQAIKTEDDNDKAQANNINEIVKKKTNRKRRAVEETGGDGANTAEEVKKKELKNENVGDNEAVKDSISHTEFEIKSEGSACSTSSRPSRASKTSSRYYKGPEKVITPRPTRSTRNK